MVFSPEMNRLSPFLQALRVHQWLKNTLLFVPLLTSHKLTELGLVLQAGYAFMAFSLCASSVYIVNDLRDLEADRQHPHKRFRPFAARLLNVKTGVLLVPLLLIGAGAITFLFLTPLFGASLALYVGLATAYTFYFKRVLIIDVLILAALYTLRVLSGGIAVSISVSHWLLAFSMFLFLSLAFLKRYSELRMTQQQHQMHVQGRSYAVEDIDLLRSIGPTSGYLSVLVLGLYINSKDVVPLYQHPAMLWLIGPCLLYWLTRMWLLANRGEMADDPLVFSVKDAQSYVVGFFVATIIILASV
jgi:4-hydroxybenzoate polyprenyltransferase